jgi:hypothetical protein
MQITKLTMTIFGKRGFVYRVEDANGEVLKVCATLSEAQQWMAQQ